MTGKPFTASDLAAVLAVDPPMSEQRLLAGLQGSRAVPQNSPDVAGLAAELQHTRYVLETCRRVLAFDLKKLVTFGPDFNQAAKDALDAVTNTLARPIPAAVRAEPEPSLLLEALEQAADFFDHDATESRGLSEGYRPESKSHRKHVLRAEYAEDCAKAVRTHAAKLSAPSHQGEEG